MTTRRRRVRRWIAVAALTVVLLLGAAVLFLRVQFAGGALAGTLESMLNEKMRGRIEIRSIDWPTRALTKVVTGGWIPFTMKGVDVWDAEGKQILHVEKITCELDIHAAMFGRNAFVFRNVVLDGGWVILEEIPEPYPLHAYDTTVVSLVAAFYGERKPGFRAGRVADSPPPFDIRDIELRNIDVHVLFGPYQEGEGEQRVTKHTFVADLHGIHGSGFLYTDPSDPIVPKLYFAVPSGGEPLRAASAEIIVADQFPFALTDVEMHQLEQLPRNWPRDTVANTLRLDVTARSEGASIRIHGELQEYWDSPYGGTYALQATITNAGAMAKRSIDESMGGKNLTITADIMGPILYPKVEATLTDLQYSVELREGEPPLQLFLKEAKAGFDLATDQGYLDRAIASAEQRGPRGEVELSANFGISPYYVDANLDITQPIDLAPWLPPDVKRIVGSQIRGHFHARGDADINMEVDDLDLYLGRVHLDRGTILAQNSFDMVHLRGLRARAGDTTAILDGHVDTGDEAFELTIDLESGDLGTWLKRAGMPAFARTARGGVKVGGDIRDPTASGDVRFSGVEVIDDLDTSFTYADTVLTIKRGRSTKIGDIRASGEIHVDGTPRAKGIVVTGRNLDLSKVPGTGGLITGKASLDVKVSGPLDQRLSIDATLASDDVTVLGQRATRLRACYNHDPAAKICQEAVPLDAEAAASCSADARKGGRCVIAGITRVDGGAATVVAHTDARGRLGGHVAIDQLPLDAVAQLAGTGALPAGGTARLAIDLSGTMEAPTANGSLAMMRTWLLGAYLGDERFEIRVATTDDPATECAEGRPAPSKTSTGRLALCGQLYDGRLVVAAVIGTSGTLPAKVRVDLRRIEVDPFIDLEALIGAPAPVRAWTSGSITFETELLADKPAIDLQLELSELAMLLERQDGDGRPSPLVISAATPLSLHFDGTTAKLGRPVTFKTPAGELTLDGSATQDQLDLAVAGKLDMTELEPLLGNWFDEAQGKVTIAATVKGTLDAPRLAGSVELAKIMLRPARQDTEIRIDYAKIDHHPTRGLSFGPLTIAVDDPSSGEHAELTAHGGIKLDGMKPARWAVIVDGELAGKMLLAFAPQQLSQASGVAHLTLDISGEGADPVIGGELTFDPSRPFSVMPRGLRRDIILSDGRIEFTEDEVILDEVSGSLDDEGRLTHVNGQIDLEDGAPVAGELSLTADGLPFRIPRTLDLVLSADNLEIRWGDDVDGDGNPDMEIDGTLEIVQGRYIRNFSFGEFLRPSDNGGSASKPFWEEYPMLGNAVLALDIDARSLSVVNNVANIELAGEVRLTGTPRDPRLEGEVLVQRGTFKPQFTRARFTRTHGSVSFSRFSRFPDTTPSLNIQSEADYRDSTGQDHLISLSLSGTLSQLTWDLSTSSGLNKSQTLTLIVAGRAPNDARAGTTEASDPTKIDPSTNPTDSAADQILKDFAGDFISLLVADPLKDVEIFDVARVEVGTGSIGFHGERKVYSNTNVVGDVEQTVRGRTINVRMEIKSTIGVTLQLGWLDKKFDDPAEEDVTDREAKLVYRWFLP